jgi:hypothetical protein
MIRKKKVKQRILKGMFRPEWVGVWDMARRQHEKVEELSYGWYACNCGRHIALDEVREHWQRGHLDTPVYSEVEI